MPGIGPVKLEAYGPDLTSMFEELRLPGDPTRGAGGDQLYRQLKLICHVHRSIGVEMGVAK
jgi:hypothetical protein